MQWAIGVNENKFGIFAALSSNLPQSTFTAKNLRITGPMRTLKQSKGPKVHPLYFRDPRRAQEENKAAPLKRNMQNKKNKKRKNKLKNSLSWTGAVNRNGK